MRVPEQLRGFDGRSATSVEADPHGDLQSTHRLGDRQQCRLSAQHLRRRYLVGGSRRLPGADPLEVVDGLVHPLRARGGSARAQGGGGVVEEGHHARQQRSERRVPATFSALPDAVVPRSAPHEFAQLAHLGQMGELFEEPAGGGPRLGQAAGRAARAGGTLSGRGVGQPQSGAGLPQLLR
ncbi:hypothetical protein [Streptomyces chartreusis]|uniref:hypothetical protein n=1 Tax=Streptomyces chartreusis TaxID=1969 RepID=UPI00365FACBE